MTAIEAIREQVAARASRTAYRQARDRLTDWAREAMLPGFTDWAEQLYELADAADAAYRRECLAVGLRPHPTPRGPVSVRLTGVRGG